MVFVATQHSYMEIYKNILGNIHSPEWKTRLATTKIDYIELDQWNAQKSRLLAIGESGKAYAMAFERGVKLTDGDIIAYDSVSNSASVVRLRLGDVMVIDLSSLTQHAIGNQHWAALVRGDSLMVPLMVDRKVMLGVMHTYNFEGISFSFRPGSEIVPFLTPSEIRSLFGSTSPQSHQPHSHSHPHAIAEYV